MTDNKNYWVVEYRYAVSVLSGETPEEAVALAAEDIRKEFGFKPDNWYARVFKYGASTTEVGPLEEYFYNPTGSKMRLIDKNDEEHGRLFHEKAENEDV